MTSRPSLHRSLRRGQMGFALLQGLADLGLSSARTTVLEPFPSEELKALCAAGVRLNPPDEDLSADAGSGHQPQALDAGAAARKAGRSADAGLVDPRGQGIADAIRVLRRPGRHPRHAQHAGGDRYGITAAAASPGVTAVHRAIADTLLSAVGAVDWVDDEGLIDAVTAVPAPVPPMSSCSPNAAEAGAPPACRPIWRRGSPATRFGSGELMHRSPELQPSQLRQRHIARRHDRGGARRPDGRRRAEAPDAKAVAAAVARARRSPADASLGLRQACGPG